MLTAVIARPSIFFASPQMGRMPGSHQWGGRFLHLLRYWVRGKSLSSMVTKYKLFSSLVAYLQSFFLEHAASFILHLPADSGTKCVHFTLRWMYWLFAHLIPRLHRELAAYPAMMGTAHFFFDPATRLSIHLLAGSGTTMCTMHLAVHMLFSHDALVTPTFLP
jgi:hypothetical protein